MKILQFSAENFKNLRAVEIAANGESVVLSGKNGAGKSAILDAIVAALSGTVPERPVRRGHKRAEIVVETDAFTVKKILTDKTARLEIVNADGIKYPSPQAMLDKLIGDISFDPIAFERLKPKAQRALLADLVGLNSDEYATQRQQVFDDRTAVNREIKTLEGQVAGLTRPDPTTPDTEVSIQQAMEHVAELEAQERACQEYDREQQQARDAISRNKAHMAELQAQIARLEEDNATRTREMLAVVAPPAVEADAIAQARATLVSAESINQRVRAKQAYLQASRALKEKRQAADQLTKRLEDLESARAEQIAAAPFPVPGLALGDDDVLFDGLPFSQLSTGQRMRISTAIAMALNPELRVIFVREGALLDEEAMAAIIALAKEHDYQLWIEKCDGSGTVGLYIEAGEIRSTEGQAHAD